MHCLLARFVSEDRDRETVTGAGTKTTKEETEMVSFCLVSVRIFTDMWTKTGTGLADCAYKERKKRKERFLGSLVLNVAVCT